MHIFKCLGVLVLMAFLSSCEEEVIRVVDGNQPPIDSTITFQHRDRYIERVYITVLGRKPDSTEQAAARSLMDPDPWDASLRSLWLSSIIQARDASVKRWDDIRSELLESVDTNTISFTIFNLQQIHQNAPPSQKPFIQSEIDRMLRIQYAADSLHSGAYSVRDLHRYAVNNRVYDEINMGSENFVVSMFDHFLFRYPTQFELDASKNMVEGFQDVLFLENGSNKEDFLDIFFSSNAYAEGQIRYVYLNYLFREPTTTELQAEKSRYQLDYNFRALQVRVLTSDEYFTL